MRQANRGYTCFDESIKITLRDQSDLQRKRARSAGRRNGSPIELHRVGTH